MNHARTYYLASFTTLLTLMTLGPFARADIFQWEYISPDNPAQGKQRSTTLAPDGAGVTARPAENLSNRNLTMAYMIGADLSAIAQFDEFNDVIGYFRANLTGANLHLADLSDAKLSAATINGANLNQANLARANFAAYEDNFGNFHPGADLMDASLVQANLSNANFFGAAIIRTDFSQANLSNANFFLTSLSDANLSDADVRGANMFNSGISAAQLYSTGSYTSHDLRGVNLGAHAFPGANFADQNLTGAGFLGADLTSADLNHATLQSADLRSVKLTDANLSYANLTNANFRQTPGVPPAVLTNANFSHATLTNANLVEAMLSGANLSDADVRGANFFFDVYGTGITAAQLYSTASYQARDLTGIGLGFHNLSGANFAGQNLTNASFQSANLSGANFSGAQVRGAYFASNPGISITLSQIYSTASYQSHDLAGITLGGNTALNGANFAGQILSNATFDGTVLTNADLSQADLTNATFNYVTLTGANLSGANVRGAKFTPEGAGGISLSQLYSTASYQAHDLTGIGLGHANLAGANFAGQFLTKSSFYGANLANADLSQSDLRNASFYGANLTGANLSGADVRGADFQFSTLSDASTANLIQSDGHIAGLDLTAGRSLVVRDHDGNFSVYPYVSPLPVVVDQRFSMNGTGKLRMEFDVDPWSSIVAFEPGIPVALGGTLELAFAPDVNAAAQLGRTIDLFDWIGVTPTGAFTVASSLTWDVSRLYDTGEITLIGIGAGLAGDFNGDGAVDAVDLAQWQGEFAMSDESDADLDGDSDGADFLTWQRLLGQGASAVTTTTPVPEPASAVVFALGIMLLTTSRAGALVRRDR